MTLGNFAAAAISVVWLSKGTWKKKVIQEKPPVEPPKPEGTQEASEIIP